MSKPTFVFVPGAWHSPDAYDGVISRLTTFGFESVKVSLPSVGCDPPTEDFSDDVSAIKEAVTKLIDTEKDVVLVAHSYGGLPCGEMPKELSSSDRASKDLRGGIIRLVLIASFLALEGFQMVPKGSGEGMPPMMNTDLEVRPRPISQRIFPVPDMNPEHHICVPKGY